MTIVQNFSEGISRINERTKNIEHNAEELEYEKYPYEQYDYAATLKKHIEAKHLGATYSCNLCPYQDTQKQHLKGHLKLKH